MAKTADTRQDSGVADASAELGRIAVDMLRNAPALPIHPLMAHPAAALAAMTAIGFGFSSQLAGAFLGAMQGAAETAGKLAVALDETNAVPADEKPTAKRSGAGDVPPVKAAPVAKPAAPKVRAVKTAAPKAPVVKVAARTKAKAEAAAPIGAEPAVSPVSGRKAAVKTDDLKRISGIGPKLEQVLNGRGIQRYADIAVWSDADIERIDAELGFDGRIRRDDWVGQARALQPKGRK